MKPIPHANSLLIEQICDPVSVAIAANRGDKFQHYAMGMLFAIDEDVFLVTCQHSIVDIVKTGEELWVSNASAKKAHRLVVDFHFPNIPALDIAVAKLPDYLVELLSPNRFVRQRDLFHSHQPLGIPCVMYGVLAELSRKWDRSVKTTDRRLKTTSFVGRTSAPPFANEMVDSEIHFLIYAGNTVSTDVGPTESKVSEFNASLRGLSGTPVFAVSGNPYEDGWQTDDTKIIGIQSSVVTFLENGEPHNYLKVIRIEFLHYMLSEVFPTEFKRLMTKLN